MILVDKNQDEGETAGLFNEVFGRITKEIRVRLFKRRIEVSRCLKAKKLVDDLT